MAKLDMDAWRRHVHQGRIPFRSDCRICAEAMGRDSPHRGTGGSATHFVLSVDICGPFENELSLCLSGHRGSTYFGISLEQAMNHVITQRP